MDWGTAPCRSTLAASIVGSALVVGARSLSLLSSGLLRRSSGLLNRLLVAAGLSNFGVRLSRPQRRNRENRKNYWAGTVGFRGSFPHPNSSLFYRVCFFFPGTVPIPLGVRGSLPHPNSSLFCSVCFFFPGTVPIPSSPARKFFPVLMICVYPCRGSDWLRFKTARIRMAPIILLGGSDCFCVPCQRIRFHTLF